WDLRRDEQRALVNASDVAHLRVALCQRSHGQIMRRPSANVTRHAPVLGSARVPRVGEAVSGSRTFSEGPPLLRRQRLEERLFRRDAETSTRDACATQSGSQIPRRPPLAPPKTDASRAGSVTGNFTGMPRSAGPLSFFQASQIFAFIARKIFGAK